jgi:SAM-dependent methyltransferase
VKRNELRQQVFAAVPALAEGVLGADERTPASLRDAYDNAVVLLSRDLASAGGRKRAGAFYTPEHIVDEIVERTLGPLFDERSRRARTAGAAALDVLLDLRVLDPAAGSGHFLVGATSYLARRIAGDPSYGGELTLGELEGLVAERCIYGVDINPVAVEVARLRCRCNLRVGNSLVDGSIDPPVAGFDAVIGNPPYVRIQELGRDVARYCRERYATAHGAFDAYVPFIERGLELLRPHGRLGFIVPSKFLKLGYGGRLRARLARDRLVESIHDFGDTQKFDGVTNYTCILILDRAGVPELEYTAPTGGSERYATCELGPDPWLLLGHEDRAILDAMLRAGPPLGEVTRQIFQGLITSADHVYILESRGIRNGRHVVRDRDGVEFELEPDLLHPLASGSDVERFALRRLRSVLLFPYTQARLMSEDELRRLPLTWEYLGRHEQTLRQRERGKMDRDCWWGYVYPKNLDLHDEPKLGIPRLCTRLRAGADPGGEAYLDNVDVNGVLVDPTRASVWKLTSVLNSRIVDFAFRRGSVPFQNAFFSANKQFVAWLPVPESADVEGQGQRLYELAAAVDRERCAFLDWLESVCGTPLARLRGWKKLQGYAQDRDAALAVLDVNDVRAQRERIAAELDTSAARIGEHRLELDRLEQEVHLVLADAYGLTSGQAARCIA